MTPTPEQQAKIAEFQEAMASKPKPVHTPESDAIVDRLREKMDSAFDSEIGRMKEEEWVILCAAFPSADPEESFCDIDALKSEIWW